MYKLCMAFSMRRNFLDLPKAEESNPALRILYGTRTFCILMIIMDHRFGTYLSGPMFNFDYIEKVTEKKNAVDSRETAYLIEAFNSFTQKHVCSVVV